MLTFTAVLAVLALISRLGARGVTPREERMLSGESDERRPHGGP